MNWQPIETAPKDGTLILGYDIKDKDWKSGKKHARYYYGIQKDCDGYEFRVSPVEVVCWVKSKRITMRHIKDNLYEQVELDTSHWVRSQGWWSPTHWMPLPEPPKEKK